VRLLGHDGLSGALGSAGTALQALAGIDLVVELTHVDSLGGALSSAGTAGQALIGDNESHDVTSYVLFDSIPTCKIGNCRLFSLFSASL
jgi:hypothetical protein